MKPTAEAAGESGAGTHESTEDPGPAMKPTAEAAGEVIGEGRVPAVESHPQ